MIATEVYRPTIYLPCEWTRRESVTELFLPTGTMASLRSNKSSVHTEEQPPQPEEQPALSLQQTPKGRKPSCLISVRAYPRIVAYCIALSLSALLTGYDVVIVGSITALPQFQ